MTKQFDEAISQLPSAWPEDLLPTIRARSAKLGRTIVVLDDDPTGTQTVADVPVLTTWSVDALAVEFDASEPIIFVLTNSRALVTQAAEQLAIEIGTNLVAASEATGRQFLVVSRSDSTLRGHYPQEVDSLAAAIGLPDAPQIVLPFFEEGGRVTIADVHYVVDAGRLIPAAKTPFAKDASFGYENSNLNDWVREKFNGAGRPAPNVQSVSISELRCEGPAAVEERLSSLADGDVCIVNAVETRDVEVFAAAAIETELKGTHLVYRTAAGVVRTFAGQDQKHLLGGQQLVDPNVDAGLIVAGSYVPKTTRQLEQLELLSRKHRIPLKIVTLDVHKILSGADAQEVDRAATVANEHLAEGTHVVLRTSRNLVTGSSSTASLHIGQAVSDALISTVNQITKPLRFLIAKGGITSSDVATKSLGIRRATVVGQILPGVPVWRTGPESTRPDICYVVFPGNVGNDNALFEAFKKLA